MPVVIERPGQNARLTFEGTAGAAGEPRYERGCIRHRHKRIPERWKVTIFRPDATTFACASIFDGSHIDTDTLRDTGTYAILINPGVPTVGLSLTLSERN